MSHRRLYHKARLGDFWPDGGAAWADRSAREPDLEIVVVPLPYNSRRQNLRWRLWCRDPYCVWCGFLFIDPDFATVEHLLPRAFGGRNTMTNCRLACPVCNHKRGKWYERMLHLLRRRRALNLQPNNHAWRTWLRSAVPRYE